MMSIFQIQAGLTTFVAIFPSVGILSKFAAGHGALSLNGLKLVLIKDWHGICGQG
jgi:hypothetical protein